MAAARRTPHPLPSTGFRATRIAPQEFPLSIRKYGFGNFTLDPAAGELWHNSRLVSLSSKQIAVLEMLVQNPGKVLPRSEIAETVWQDCVTGESQIVQTIYWLRKSLAQCSAEVLIVAEPDAGYRFAAGVTVINAEAAPQQEPHKATPAMPRAHSTGPQAAARPEYVAASTYGSRAAAVSRGRAAAAAAHSLFEALPADDETFERIPNVKRRPAMAKVIPISFARPVSAYAASSYDDAADAGKLARKPSITTRQLAMWLLPSFLTVLALAFGVWLVRHNRPAAQNTPVQQPAPHVNIAAAIAHDTQAENLAALRGDLQSAVSADPGDRNSATQLAEVSLRLGEGNGAVEFARKRLATHPDNATRLLLASALIQSGRPAPARDELNKLIAAGDDDWAVHDQLLRADFLLGDQHGAEAQLDAGRVRGADYRVTSDQAWLDACAGRLKDAARLWDIAASQAVSAGAEKSGTAQQNRAALILFFAGQQDTAKAMLASIAPAAWDDSGATALALLGEGPTVEQFIRREQAAHPESTLSNNVELPEVRAASYLNTHDYLAAVRELEAVRPYQHVDNTAAYLRGLALLARGDGVAAEHEFASVMANRGVDPLSPLDALAQLGAARAERMQGRSAAAKTSYARFFALWQKADPDMPLLAAAHSEAAALR